MTRRSVLAMGAGLLAAPLAACGASSGRSSSGSDGLTLYNGQHEQTTQALVAAFKQQTGINVTIRSDDEDVLVAQIIAEGSRSPADLMYTENSPPLMKLQEQRLLAGVDAGTLAAVPARYNSPAGDWAGVSGRVALLVYNTSKLTASALPTSVMDLASSRWSGKLGIAPQETDFQPIITSVAKTHGTAAALTWLKALKSNAGSASYDSNETLVAKINSGQSEIGLINHYYWYRLRAQLGAAAMHSAIAFFAAEDPGYILDVSGAAVLASSPRKTAAQKFLKFLVSAAGQQIIARSDSFEYPLRPGVSAHSGLTPLSALHPAALTIADLGDGSGALSLLQQAQLG